MATSKIAVITLFPEMFTAITHSGITRRALQSGLLELEFFNPRDFSQDKHRRVDDRPFGGGPGMVMRVEPLQRALDAGCSWQGVHRDDVRVIYLSPQGEVLTRDKVCSVADLGNLVLIAGRYEGVDERFIEREVDEELSIGDYVLSGGELPAMVLIDAMIRRIPGALGDEQSAVQDSFEQGRLDCPHYTRPEIYEGMQVPEVLLSGDHQRIANWRREQSLRRTWSRRR
ncbi:MAG: tRNA (guanosine(37)-N1)-methyltransferase TrmD, partial [Cellvibrionaceae bacterium]|nr:tRNA (guanosine(37)-N1)-methyltransferase TrmD [Cellvibrionaceae bacterium]